MRIGRERINNRERKRGNSLWQLLTFLRERWIRLPRRLRSFILATILVLSSSGVSYNIGFQRGIKEERERITTELLGELKNTDLFLLLKILKGGEYQKHIELKNIPPEIEGESWLGILKLNNGEIVDVEDLLKRMIEKKKEWIERNMENQSKKEIIFKKLEELKLKLLSEYKNNTGEKISFNEFKNFIRGCFDISFDILDEEKLSQSFENKERFPFFEQITNDEFFRDYLCYTSCGIIMTEIRISSDNGQKNKTFLETIINNLGINFLNLIIAMNDEKISYGPYQFTDQAVGDDDKVYPASYLKERVVDNKNIANKIREMLGENLEGVEKIILDTNVENLYPTDVINIKPEQHYFGEVSLFTYYLIYLIDNLNEEDFKKLKEIYSEDKKIFCEKICLYLAYCHHKGPNSAINFFRDLLNKLPGVEDNFYYVKIFKKNLEALKNS